MKKYVIVAPSFVPNSGGIKVLHRLCHVLNEAGQEAYIWPMLANDRAKFNLNPNYNTAIADTKILKTNPIVVYPEIVIGNPLNARTVVRWLLNKPGAIGGDGIYGDDDIIFYFTKYYADKEGPVDLLQILGLADDFFDIFRNYGHARQGSCYVIHKGDRRKVKHNLNASCEIVDITPSEKLADIFNSKIIFYSYDAHTFLSGLAALCGCISIVIPDERVDEAKWRETEPYGIGFGMSDVDHAISTMHLVKPHLQHLEAESYKQLERFIEITQKAAESRFIAVAPHHYGSFTSIVILTFNELKYTRECIESIKKHTPEPHEVILIDNASTDGTVKWLRRLVKENANYRLIENEKNLGFAKGCNQGIEAASGEYILLLNNDVVVTDNWLSGLLECLNSGPDTGIIGPMTNSISGPQKIRGADYKTMNQMHDYAKAFREKYRHRRIPLQRIVGFCMLFRHQLADKIGLLDQSFGTGNFEDDDYCLRSTLAGCRNLIAGDVFIHHYGSRSFIGNRIDYSSAMTGNIKIFDEKWTGIDANTPLGKKVAAFNFIANADKLNQKGHIDKAIGMIIEGIKYAPEEKALYYHLAEMLLDEKLYKDVLEAINSMPAGAEADLRRLEIIAYCTEDLKEAAKYTERILELDKAYASAWNLKGSIAHKQGDNGAAESFYRQAIAVDPGYGNPYTNLGVLKWESDTKEEALDFLEKGFILTPTATDNVTLYHSAITALERFERAEKIFKDAKELYPDNKRILFFMIDILIKQGKFEMAMHEVERAMLDIGIDDGMLSAALALREKVGSKEIIRGAKNKGTLSLCMIVKDEEKHLARCLLSAGPAVDEMIVVDTGSTDRTMDIAKAYGAKVFEFPWTNDFSEARNCSLSHATGDWILVLDADEVISPLDYAEFEKIVKNRQSRSVAYTMITRNYTYEVTSKGWTANDRKYLGEEAGTGWFPSAKVRLFVNDKRIRFQNPVHEFVEASLREAGIETKLSAIPVHHYGRFDKDKIREKGKKYFLLGKKKIEEMKGDFNAMKELATQASELGEFETAVELWKEAIKIDQTQADAFLNIGYAYLKLEQYQEALEASRRATELDPSMKEATLNYAGSEFLIGDVGKAISLVKELLQKQPDYPPATLLLATAYYVEGEKEKGLALFENLRKRGFNWTDFVDEQARGAISLGKVDQAILLLEVAIETRNINTDTHRLLAELKKR